MKRWLFNLVAAVSLLLSLTAAAAWAMSYARPLDWHLLGIAHSADLTRVNLDRAYTVSMTPATGRTSRPRVLGRAVGAEPVRETIAGRSGR